MILFELFSLSLLIVTLVFLNYVRVNADTLPDYNDAMFGFVWVGHWIMVAVIGILLLMLAFVAAFGNVKWSYNETRTITPAEEVVLLEPEQMAEVMVERTKKTMSRRKKGTRRLAHSSAQYTFINSAE